MAAKKSTAQPHMRAARGFLHYPEDDSPKIKPPADFIGQGLEIIGSREDSLSVHASLIFHDGKFFSLSLPVRSLVSSSNQEGHDLRRKSFLRYMATRQAEKLAKNPADKSAEVELKRILKECRNTKPRERAIENAVRKIRSGDFSENWSFQNVREKLAVEAVIETAREFGRPPTEAEVIDWMKSVPDPNGGKLIKDGERKHLAELLRESGFGWLERSPRGRRRTP